MRNPASKKKLLDFMLENYLNYFDQWDHFVKDFSLGAVVDAVLIYSSDKLACFQRFLQNTGSSKHNLSATKTAFESFWQEVRRICNDQNVDCSVADNLNGKKFKLKDIISITNYPLYTREKDKKYLQEIIESRGQQEAFVPSNWETPQGGNPIVYMERMLTILKNARDIREQINYIPGMKLDNHGAYYASTKEEFKLIANYFYVPLAFDYSNYTINDMLITNCEISNYKVENIRKRLNTGEFFRLIKLMGFEYKSEHFFNLTFSPEETIYKLSILEDLVKDVRFLSKGGDIRYVYAEDEDSMYLIKNEGMHISKERFKELVDNNEAILHANWLSSKQSLNCLYYPYKYYRVNPDGSASFVKKSFHSYKEDKGYIAMINAFICQQEGGVKIDKYEEFIKEFIKENRWYITDSESYLIVALLNSHKNYKDDISLKEIYYKARSLKTEPPFLIKSLVLSGTSFLCFKLIELWKKGIKLNAIEGGIIIDQINGLNSAEFESSGFKKQEIIDAIFNNIQEDKYATLRALNAVKNTKFPLKYALDTKEWFAQDPDIKLKYNEDLLLFSVLVNVDNNTSYHVNVERIVKIPFQNVKNLLNKAAKNEGPNNIDYAFKLFLDAREYAKIFKVQAAFEEINKLTSYDENKVKQIFAKNGLPTKSTSTGTPDKITTENGNVLGVLTEMIMIAKRLKSMKSKISLNPLEIKTSVLNAIEEVQRAETTKKIDK